MNREEMKVVLQAARPRLRLVSPLAHHICWGYAVVNVLIGLSIIFLYRPNVEILIINDLFTIQVWGMIFITNSLLTMYSLINDNWPLLRKALLFGVAIKFAWLVALIFRIPVNPGTSFIAILWALLAYIQALTYVYLVPKAIENTIEGRDA